MLEFSYETFTVSYEIVVVSYEKLLDSYEIASVSYESVSVSYGSTHRSHSKERICSCCKGPTGYRGILYADRVRRRRGVIGYVVTIGRDLWFAGPQWDLLVLAVH